MNLTSSGRAGSGGLRGSQDPRVRLVPDYVSTTGPEAVDLCKLVGLHLVPWQASVLTDSLGEDEFGKWTALENGLLVPRQNGKTEILLARILVGLFLIGEEEIIYSSHRADTSLGIFRRFAKLLRQSKVFGPEVKAVRTANGQEGVELKSGQRVGFRTRAQEGGRGFSADCIIFDEAFEISEELLAALLPTLVARSNPQVWYTGTAVDQQVHRNGVVFTRVRERGLAGVERLAYFEWSHEGTLDDYDLQALDDRRVWAATNPSLGYHVDEELIALNRRSFKSRKFAAEHLCIGDWPVTDEGGEWVIPRETWRACEDPYSKIDGTRFFAVDGSIDRSKASVAVAGRRSDDLFHVEIVENLPGTSWLVPMCQVLQKKNPRTKFVVDKRGPLAGFIPDFKAARVRLEEVDAQQYAQACGELYDCAVQDRLRFPAPQPELEEAVAAAIKRPLGDAWAWDRRKSEADITPLVSSTLALWMAQQKTRRSGGINLSAIAAKAIAEGRAPDRCPRCLAKYDLGGPSAHSCRISGWSAP